MCPKLSVLGNWPKTVAQRLGHSPLHPKVKGFGPAAAPERPGRERNDEEKNPTRQLGFKTS